MPSGDDDVIIITNEEKKKSLAFGWTAKRKFELCSQYID